MKTHYPKWRYHRTLQARIVESEEEDKALGKGWEDTPAAFDEPEPEPEPEVKEPRGKSKGKK